METLSLLADGFAVALTPENLMLAVAGCILGTIIGALIMAVLTNGLRVLSVAQEWQTVVTGAIIILAVYADMVRRKKSG